LMRLGNRMKKKKVLSLLLSTGSDSHFIPQVNSLA
jgi:hypothetical protein